MSKHMQSICKEEQDDGSEIASEWDENDLDLCIKNYQAQQSSMSEPVDNKNKERMTAASKLMLFNIIRKHIETKLLTKRQWNADCFKKADWNVVTTEFNQKYVVDQAMRGYT